jgi:hypothetical protein
MTALDDKVTEALREYAEELESKTGFIVRVLSATKPGYWGGYQIQYGHMGSYRLTQDFVTSGEAWSFSVRSGERLATVRQYQNSTRHHQGEPAVNMFTKTYSKRAVWRFLITMGLSALAVASLLFCIGKANADAYDEQNYLAEITNHGVTIKDVTGAIGIGYAICAGLPHENGETMAEEMWHSLPESSPLTLTDMRVLVVSSVHNLCPWEYHGSRGVAA